MSYPEEPDLTYICKQYIVMCDEYPGVYEFMRFLDNLRYCEFTNDPQDWFTFKNGIIQSHWVIFVSCLPKDMNKLCYVAKRSKYPIDIVDDTVEECDNLIPFV